MQIDISQPAFQWFKKELRLESGDEVRFFVRYGGHSTVQQGFSLGVTKEKATDIGSSTEVNGITFYIRRDDLWYFDNHDFKVKYNRATDSIEYSFSE